MVELDERPENLGGRPQAGVADIPKRSTRSRQAALKAQTEARIRPVAQTRPGLSRSPRSAAERLPCGKPTAFFDATQGRVAEGLQARSVQLGQASARVQCRGRWRGR